MARTVVLRSVGADKQLWSARQASSTRPRSARLESLRPRAIKAPAPRPCVTMPAAHLPKNCRVADLFHALDKAGAFGDDWRTLVLHLPTGCFVHCSSLAFLCAWGRLQSAAGRRLKLTGDPDTVGYLARMDLQDHLGLDYDPGNRRAEVGRFLPLRLIHDGKDVKPIHDAVCELVVRQFDSAEVFMPAVAWAVNEILDNVLMHSDSAEPGAVCAQYFPRKHRLDIGICDVGRGILASLSDLMPLWSHGHAVTTALERGVTRNSDIGQGNGLAGAREIATRNRGGFQLWTGDVVYRLEDGREPGFVETPEVPGTGVVFSLDTRRPVDLTETWIAGPEGRSYLRAEAERIATEGGLRVVEECDHTGTRAPAERLRRKILSVLGETTAPMRLDFTGVERASSSFLDELLGRLAFELGPEDFARRIDVRGMRRLIANQANVVITQRVEGEPGQPG